MNPPSCFVLQIPLHLHHTRPGPLARAATRRSHAASRRICTRATMTKPVSDLRVNYSRTGLDQSKMPLEPFALFAEWMAEAQKANEPEPNAMSLATVGLDGRPSARMVLLKGVDRRGFVFYTNYESQKGLQLAAMPFAALTFWWAGLERSVRVEGGVTKVAAHESDKYFASRPPRSRLGAWASEQSRPLESRQAIETRWKNLQMEYLDEHGELKKETQRPPHWGGFRLVPDRIEFWKGRSARLHDRIVYKRPLPPVAENCEEEALGEDLEWTIQRLQP